MSKGCHIYGDQQLFQCWAKETYSSVQARPCKIVSLIVADMREISGRLRVVGDIIATIGDAAVACGIDSYGAHIR
jgi:hypothetical protein